MKIAKFLILIALISSCVPQKRLEYLQKSPKSPDVYNLKIPVENKIAPGDYLNIRVKSLDEGNFFEAAGGGSGSATNEIMLSQGAFLVDSLGEVNLPEIGKVNVSGLSLQECSDKLQKIVKSYLSNPTVDVRYAYKSYTILGEVNRPGRYFFSKKGLNIFEAIGDAGDLSYYGKRKSVYIIREHNNQAIKIKVDLTDDELLLSDNYYIQDKDIVLIKSRNYIRWGEISTPLGIVMSSISLYLILQNYLDNQNVNGN